MNKPSKLAFYSLFLLLFLKLSLLSSCVDEEIAPTPPAEEKEPQLDNPNLAINDWIYENMNNFYYWESEMPSQVDKTQEPKDFFESLKSSNDRFSVIYPDYQELINSLSGVNLEAGYEMKFFRLSETSQEVVGRILYVKKSSPASQAGLQRGDEITKINGQSLNLSNYRDLLKKTSATHELDYLRYNSESNEYEAQETLSLNVVELSENPHFLDTVYTFGGHKVGYYVYNFFSPGTNNTKEYDNQMDQIIAQFKSKAVTDLVLDLRYNSGGAVSSSTNLASLIGQNVDGSKIFYTYRWNEGFQQYFESKEDGEKNLRGMFLNKTNAIGNQIGGKVYVLTGKWSASASEMIINGLKPYMEVVLIGDKTVGKNVGSFAIDDKENEENKYGMLPIVFQIFNSQGSSDYSGGFLPDHEVNDFELPMLQLGDVQEPLLATALSLITGVNARRGATTARVQRSEGKPLISTIDDKVRTNRLIMDGPVPAFEE